MMNLAQVKDYFYPNRILDIGANIGQFHRFAKSIFPNSFIFSIEAEPSCEKFLKEITNNYYIGLLAKDISAYNFYKLKSRPENTGNSIYRELGEHYTEENTEIKTRIGELLDSVLLNVEPFDLIKIDTQGSELDIISGGMNVCSKAKAILLEVSLTQCNLNAPLYPEVVKFMDNIGFKVANVLNESTYKEFKQQDILFLNKQYLDSTK